MNANEQCRQRGNFRKPGETDAELDRRGDDSRMTQTERDDLVKAALHAKQATS